MEGKKFDGEKPRMYLLPPKALTEVAKVLTFGATKYDENNWKKLDNLQNRYSGAALRHIFSHMDGEEFDDETGLDHLAHAICCLLFKLEAKLEKSKEERPRKSIGLKYKESDLLVGLGESYNEEGSVRDAQYSVQYNTLTPYIRGLCRETRVCKETEKPASWQTRFEYRDWGNGYSIPTRGILSGDLKGDISKHSILQECD